MIHKDEIDALEERARKARVTMPEVCERAEPKVHRQSWYRSRKRGRMEYGPFGRLERALGAIEAEQS